MPVPFAQTPAPGVQSAIPMQDQQTALAQRLLADIQRTPHEVAAVLSTPRGSQLLQALTPEQQRIVRAALQQAMSTSGASPAPVGPAMPPGGLLTP